MDNHDLELSIEKIKQEKVLASVKTGIVIVNSDFTISQVNSQAVKYLKLCNDITGKNITNVLSERKELSSLCEFLSNRNDNDRFHLNLKDENYSLQISKSGIWIDGGFYGGIIFIKKVSSSKRFREMADIFVANISHELKTPLTLILGAVEALDGGAIDSKQDSKKFLNIIRKHSTRLHSLIKEMLSFASLSQDMAQGNIKFDIFDLNEILLGLKKNLELIADEKKIKIQANLMNGPILIKANKVLIEQCLINLVDNACKYNKIEGFVTIETERNDGNAVLSISDSGIGMKPKELSRVFERFYRAKEAIEYNSKGTGLGLSIVKQIVKVHDGNISVTSEVGEGSVFRVIIPSVE